MRADEQGATANQRTNQQTNPKALRAPHSLGAFEPGPRGGAAAGFIGGGGSGASGGTPLAAMGLMPVPQATIGAGQVLERRPSMTQWLASLATTALGLRAEGSGRLSPGGGKEAGGETELARSESFLGAAAKAGRVPGEVAGAAAAAPTGVRSQSGAAGAPPALAPLAAGGGGSAGAPADRGGGGQRAGYGGTAGSSGPAAVAAALRLGSAPPSPPLRLAGSADAPGDDRAGRGAATAGTKRPADTELQPALSQPLGPGAAPTIFPISGRAPKLIKLEQVLAVTASQWPHDGAAAVTTGLAGGAGPGRGARPAGAAVGDGGLMMVPTAVPGAAGAGTTPPGPPPEPFCQPPHTHMPSFGSKRGGGGGDNSDSLVTLLSAMPSRLPLPRVTPGDPIGLRPHPPAHDLLELRTLWPGPSLPLLESVGTHNIGSQDLQLPQPPGVGASLAPLMRYRESLESRLMPPPPPPPLLLPETASSVQRLLVAPASSGLSPLPAPPPPLLPQQPARPAAPPTATVASAGTGTAAQARPSAAPPDVGARGSSGGAAAAAAAEAVTLGRSGHGGDAVAAPAAPLPPALAAALPANAAVSMAQLPVLVDPPDVRPAILSQVLDGRVVELPVQVVTLRLTLPPEVVQALRGVPPPR